MKSLTLLHLASRATDSKTDSVIIKRYSFKIRGEVYRGTSTTEYDHRVRLTYLFPIIQDLLMG